MGRLDVAEARLARAWRAWGGPRAYAVGALLVVVLAFVVRLPLAAQADDVCCGHPDSWVYFHQAYQGYLSGDVYADGHRGSGWQLLLAGTLHLLGFEPAPGWTDYGAPMAGEAARAALVAHTLSAVLSAGAAAATLLLAREVLSRQGALLAAAIVAVDPLLLRLSTSAISEPLYVPLFVLATMTVLRARRARAWLLATAALMAVAHMLKVNGLVMFGMLGVFAWILFAQDARSSPAPGKPRGLSRLTGLPARDIRWGIAAVAVFFLVASPYLVWRGSQLSGPFDYGTNQRFWADDLWDLDDPWWTAYTPKEGAPRETMGDYFAKHGWRDAATRLWQSVEWQIFDLVGSGRWPAQEEEGGAWVGSPREESALTPLVAGLALVAAFTVMKRREWWFLPLAIAFTFATFVWIYPLVRSVRYFAPLVPLFTIAAVAGYAHLATLVRRPFLVGAFVFGAWFAIYAGAPLLAWPDGVALLATSSEVRVLAGVFFIVWALVAVGRELRRVWARSGTAADVPVEN